MTLCVAGILMLTALPSMTTMVQRSQTTAAINRVVVAINHARHAAVQHGVTATLCGVKPGGKCGANWAGDLTLFADHNKNARMDNNDYRISTIKALGPDNTVKWRSFQNRKYLQMTAFGYTNFQNGNLGSCPKNGNAKLARQIGYHYGDL